LQRKLSLRYCLAMKTNYATLDSLINWVRYEMANETPRTEIVKMVAESLKKSIGEKMPEDMSIRLAEYGITQAEKEICQLQ